jgi:hypothetical protein
MTHFRKNVGVAEYITADKADGRDQKGRGGVVVNAGRPGGDPTQREWRRCEAIRYQNWKLHFQVKDNWLGSPADLFKTAR